MAFRRFDLGWISMRGDLAEEPERPRLVSPFLVLTAELEGPVGQANRLVRAPGQQIRLPHRWGIGRVDDQRIERRELFDSLLREPQRTTVTP
jgi:hypothetical protein